MHSFYYTICNIICVYIYIYDTLLIMFYNNILVFHMLYFIRYIFGIACSILHNSRICVEKHTHTHTHTHVYIYIYIYIHTHIYTYSARALLVRFLEGTCASMRCSGSGSGNPRASQVRSPYPVLEAA